MSDKDYVADVKEHTSNVDEDKVKSIVNYCGIALRSKDGSLVSTSDESELETVKNGFAAKKLGLSADDADAAMKKVAERMKGDRTKERVTFYYLLAEESNTLDKL